MKKATAILLFLMMAGFINAQSLISTTFSDYESNEDYSRVSISKKMFSIMANLNPEDEDEKELINTVSNLDGLKIIVADSTANPDKLYKETLNRMPKRFEELLTVNEKSEKIVFMIDEKDGMVSELIMVLRGENQFVLLDLFGKIDLKQISNLSKKMNIEHLDQLEKLDEN
jgi:hypothetical protein